MILCVCRAVRSITVSTAIDAGAATVEAVEAACGAGGDCGTCHDDIVALLRERACAGRIPARAA